MKPMDMDKKLALIATLALASGCSSSDAHVYTLYRNSALDPTMRVHVATFDAEDGDAYNFENCQQVQDLISAQKGLATKFWCEKGRYRK